VISYGKFYLVAILFMNNALRHGFSEEKINIAQDAVAIS